MLLARITNAHGGVVARWPADCCQWLHRLRMMKFAAAMIPLRAHLARIGVRVRFVAMTLI